VVVATAGLHTWHGFDGFAAPDAMHTPPIKQPVVTLAPHAPDESVQVSVVHDTPSLHVVPVPHTPLLSHMPHPAAAPSSQRAPVCADQTVDAVALHTWHAFAGLTAPSA
jgi:hypothetical protein